MTFEQKQLVYFHCDRYFYLYNLVILGHLGFVINIYGEVGELAHTPLFTKMLHVARPRERNMQHFSSLMAFS